MQPTAVATTTGVTADAAIPRCMLGDQRKRLKPCQLHQLQGMQRLQLQLLTTHLLPLTAHLAYMPMLTHSPALPAHPACCDTNTTAPSSTTPQHSRLTAACHCFTQSAQLPTSRSKNWVKPCGTWTQQLKQTATTQQATCTEASCTGACVCLSVCPGALTLAQAAVGDSSSSSGSICAD
jgi:hypothetical protein